jgi:hypothetical protein
LAAREHWFPRKRLRGNRGSTFGHASVQTTERYLGCKQKFNHAVNENLGVEDS